MATIAKNERSFTGALRATLRFARREGLDQGLVLGRFGRIHGWETDAGPEWIADDVRGRGYVSVWHPLGEEREREAAELCEIVRRIGRHVFTVDIRRRSGQGGSPRS